MDDASSGLEVHIIYVQTAKSILLSNLTHDIVSYDSCSLLFSSDFCRFAQYLFRQITCRGG